jgi:hypothetical protein
MTLTKVHIVDAVAEQIGYTKNRSINTRSGSVKVLK